MIELRNEICNVLAHLSNGYILDMRREPTKTAQRVAEGKAIALQAACDLLRSAKLNQVDNPTDVG